MFAQNQNGPVFVEDITAGSHAEKCGVINVSGSAFVILLQFLDDDDDGGGWRQAIRP
jgi:hypothetical protein